MNVYRRLSDTGIAAIKALVVTIMLIGVFPMSPAFCERTSGDDVISLHVQNKPLGDVLQMISEMTGYVFTIEEKWKNLPISTSFENVALYRGLQRILKKLNNAIIYSPHGEITIVIYDKSFLGTIPFNDTVAQPAFGDQASLVDFSPVPDSGTFTFSEPVDQQMTSGREQEPPEQVPEAVTDEDKADTSLPPPEESQSSEIDSSAGEGQESPEQVPEPVTDEDKADTSPPPPEESQSSEIDSSAGKEQEPPAPSLSPAVPDPENAVGGSRPEIPQK